MVSAMRDAVNYNPGLRPMPQTVWKNWLSHAEDFHLSATRPKGSRDHEGQKMTCEMEVYMSTTATEVMPTREKPQA